MAKNIALEITLNGVQKSISSLQDFEKELQKLQEELGIVSTESTESFDKMSQEITKVNKDFDMLTQNLQDVDFTETVDQFTQVGDAITESFDSAQSAIQEFGNETEVVGEQAEKAMNEASKSTKGFAGNLTDLGDKFSEIPGPIGQVAQGVKGLGQAFKILIANPVGLILAAIALALTTLYKAFTSTKAGAEALERVMAGLGAVLDVIRDRFLVFVDAIKSLLTLDLVGFFNNLKGTFSGVGAEIAKETKEAMRLKGVLQEITDQTRELNKRRAEQNVLIADAKLKINDENLSYAERLKALEEVRKAEIALVQQEEDLARRRFETIQQQNAQSDSSKEALDEEAAAFIELQNKILQSKQKQKELFDQEKGLRDRQRSEQKAAADERKRLEAEQTAKRLEQLKEIERVATEELQKEIDKVKELRFTIEKPVPEPQVLTQLKETLSVYDQLSSTFDQNPPFEVLKKNFDDLLPSIESAGRTLDTFGALYQKNRKALSEGAQKDLETFQKTTAIIREEFFQAFSTGEITKEAFDSFKQIETAYSRFNLNVKKINKDSVIFDTEQYFDALKSLKIVNGEIINEVDENGNRVQAITSKTYEEATRDFANIEAILTAQILKQVTEEFPAASAAKRREIAMERVKTLKDLSDTVIQEEQRIVGFYLTADEVQQDRLQKRNKAFLGLISQNIDTVLSELAQTAGLAEGVTEEAFKQLIEGTIDTTNLTEEELNAMNILWSQFYEKLDQMRQTDAEKEEETQRRKKEAILSNIESLSNQLGEVSSTLSQFSDLALERLAQDEEMALESIVGTNEEANQKRLELAQQFEGKRRQIEKQTRIQELEFARIQAVAEGAVAIIRAASTPILIPLTTALVAAQVALISGQIAQARSLQRGGKLQFGGLLEGPSHEQGGIRFGQMGLELEGGESVINRVSTAQYGSLLSTINQAGGGRPLVSSGYDDSRLLEALAKQRSEPIRAYVLEQEITNKQAVSSRLESLSTL